MKHGEGNEKFIDGDVCIGSYINGKPEGYGEYLWGYFLIMIKRLTVVTYRLFLNGLRHGQGIWCRGPSN